MFCLNKVFWYNISRDLNAQGARGHVKKNFLKFGFCTLKHINKESQILILESAVMTYYS